MNKYLKLTVLLTVLALSLHPALAWHPDSTWVFNQWEAGVSNGSALNDPGDMRGGYSSIWRLAFYHQFSPEDFGPQLPMRYFPAVGIALTYSDFTRTNVYREVGDKEEVYRGTYGRFLSLAISFSQYHRMWGSRNQWRLRSLMENGFAWAFNPYHYPDRMGNTIGGNFQVYFHTGLYFSYAWGHHEWGIGPEFTHYSNSGTYLPNGGVNNLSVGVRYRTLAQSVFPRTSRDGYLLDEFKPYLYNSFYLAIGIHAEGERGDRATNHGDIAVYSQVNVTYNLMCRVAPTSSIGLGVDFFSGCEAEQISRPWWGLGLKHETFYRRFAISVGVGYYLNGMHRKGRGDSKTRIYEKIGLKYYLPVRQGNRPQPYVSYHIKGNEFYAEQFEIGIGFTFGRFYRSGFLQKLQKRWRRQSLQPE